MTAGRITLLEAYRLLGLSKRELYSRVGNDHSFPPMIKVIGKGIAFDADEIRAWALANPRPAAVGGTR